MTLSHRRDRDRQTNRKTNRRKNRDTQRELEIKPFQRVQFKFSQIYLTITALSKILLIKKERETETQRQRHGQRQTDRQRQTSRQRQTNRQTEADKRAERKTKSAAHNRCISVKRGLCNKNVSYSYWELMTRHT